MGIYSVYSSTRKRKGCQKKNLNAVNNFLSISTSLPYNIKILQNISLEINKSQSIKNKLFRFAGGLDNNNGGWVIDEFIQSFNYCVAEKSLKIEKYYNKYSKWWLIFIETIACNFSHKEILQIKSDITGTYNWNKIIVLNSLNSNKIIEF